MFPSTFPTGRLLSQTIGRAGNTMVRCPGNCPDGKNMGRSFHRCRQLPHFCPLSVPILNNVLLNQKVTLLHLLYDIGHENVFDRKNRKNKILFTSDRKLSASVSVSVEIAFLFWCHSIFRFRFKIELKTEICWLTIYLKISRILFTEKQIRFWFWYRFR